MINTIKNELKESYESFFHFSMNLVKDLDNNNDNLKFAIVNMQISLELFLKYYFIETGKKFWVFKDDKKFEFRSFSEILDKVFSNRDILMVKKKVLKDILEFRNDIVHKGKHHNWSDDLALNLINCTLFIQGLLNKEFQESLIPISYDDNEFSSNSIWRKGAENFAKNLCDLNKESVYECIYCYSRAMVNKKFFTFDEYDDEGFQCISCLRDLKLEDQFKLGFCKACNHNSFVIDHLNQQTDKTYNGCCLNCGMKYFAFNCCQCDIYFIDFDNEKLIENDKIFCTQECQEKHKKLQVTARVSLRTQHEQ